MGTMIIIAILVLILLFALRSTIKHVQGNGGCCGGGGSSLTPARKYLEGPVVCERIYHIEGMTCINCQNRVQEQINRLPGVVADVSWKRGQAVVQSDRPLKEDEVEAIIRRLDYKLIRVESVKEA